MAANELGLPVEGKNIRFRNFEWKVVRKLYDGVFSQVFMLQDAIDKRKHFAMKIERKFGCNRPLLKLDVQVLSQVNGALGFPNLITWGRTEHFKFCVMKFVGPELAALQRLMPENRFTPSTAYRVALQTLTRIETLHSHGWLNRDVKACNFAVGLGSEAHIIYMLDFGLTRRYKDANGIRPRRAYGPCVGTYCFGPLAAAYLKDQAPKDDLEGWFYMVIHMIKGSLPWFGEKNVWLDHGGTREFKEHSRKAYRKQFFKGLPLEWEKIHDVILNMRYEDHPPFHLFRALIHLIVQKQGIDFQQPYDWQVVPALVNEMERALDVRSQPICVDVQKPEDVVTAVDTWAHSLKENPTLLSVSPDVSSSYAWKSDEVNTEKENIAREISVLS